MKCAALALLVSLTTASAFAADAPKPSCNKPNLPSKVVLQSELAAKAFQRHMNEYKQCIDTFVQEQKATAEAAIQAGNDAVNDYNSLAKAYQEEMSGE
jgi:hypothetical protein